MEKYNFPDTCAAIEAHKIRNRRIARLTKEGGGPGPVILRPLISSPYLSSHRHSDAIAHGKCVIIDEDFK